jgi:hypothetical protein
MGETIIGRRFLIFSFFLSLAIMKFDAPVYAEAEIAVDESVKRALDAAKLGRSESSTRIGQVSLPSRFFSAAPLYSTCPDWQVLDRAASTRTEYLRQQVKHART